MKNSELPKGTIVSIGGEVKANQRYEKINTCWVCIDPGNVITFAEMDLRDDVKIVALPIEVVDHLAMWLDNVYAKTGNPDSLVVEAIRESQKTKHDAHISDRPFG